MSGQLSDGDGRTAETPKSNYGLGPMLSSKYMISLTANAPREAFNNPQKKFFDGLSEEELMRPMHLNFKWIGLDPLLTYIVYQMLKNPEIEADFTRFDRHLANNR